MQIRHAALPLLAILFAACGGGKDAAAIESVAAAPGDVTVGTPQPVAGEDVERPPATVSIAPGDAPAPPPAGASATETAPGTAPELETASDTADTGAVSRALLTGDVDPSSDPAFKRIPEKYLGGSRVWGHALAVDALAAMADAAAADGVQLKAVSAFRSFRDQKRIWEDKWEGRTRVGGQKLNETISDPEARARKILEFSSMPATSRHHWGTDFDLNDLTNSYFASGKGKVEYDWLTANAGRFGFCQVYSRKGADRPTGYEEEKWHWSYLPVAKAYLEQYPETIGYDHIKGFAGAEAARGINVIANYVESINPQCR